MATKPSTLPIWATDTNFASGSQVGQTTVLEPSLGYKQQGCVSGRSAPARYFNWLLNLIYQWVVYLNDLHNSAQFLNKVYAWTDLHSFNNGALVGSNLGLYAAAEGVYTNSAGASTPRTRTITRSFTGNGLIPGHDLVADTVVLANVNPGDVPFWSEPLELPQDCTIKAWKVLLQRDYTSDGSVTIEGKLLMATHNYSSPAINGESQVGSTQSTTGTNATVTIGQSGLTQAVGATDKFRITIEITAGGTPRRAKLAGYQITYEETRATGSH